MPIPVISDPNISHLLCRATVMGTSASSTRDGRLWMVLSEAGGSVTADLFRHPAMQSGDLVASGSGAEAVIELDEENDSGVSGSIELAPTAAALIAASGPLQGTVQAHIASDADLVSLEPGLGKLLDGDGIYAGELGFSWALGEGHREVYRAVTTRALDAGLDHPTAMATPVLLRDPAVLVAAAALFSLAAIMQRESARGAPETAQRALSLHQRAVRALAQATLTIIRPSGLSDLLIAMGDLRIRR